MSDQLSFPGLYLNLPNINLRNRKTSELVSLENIPVFREKINILILQIKRQLPHLSLPRLFDFKIRMTTEQTITWEACNIELVASLERLKSARAMQKLETEAQNKEKKQLEEEKAFIEKELKTVNSSLQQKVSKSMEYGAAIKKAQEAYVKIMESSRRLESIVQRKSPNLATMKTNQYSMEKSKDVNQNDSILLNSTQSSENSQLTGHHYTPSKELKRGRNKTKSKGPDIHKSSEHPQEISVPRIKKEKVTVKIERKVGNKTVKTKMHIKSGTNLQKVLRSYTSKYKLDATRLVFIENGQKLDKSHVFESSTSLVCIED